MRIVSLCPSLTELSCDLGCAAELVGVTKFCEHPAAASVEKLGGTKDPDTARILALAPDLVLMNREENRREDALVLEAAGLALHVSMPVSVSDAVASIRTLGEALGCSARANSLAERIQAREQRVRTRASARRAVRYAYLIWRRPWMAAGPDTYIDALLGTVGGQNVFSQYRERYPSVAAASLGELNPELVLLSSEPFPFKERHRQELAHITRLEVGRFRLVDGKILSWHGSHTLAGLRYADELFETAQGTPPNA